MFHLWVYLETTPLLGLACTLLAWQAAQLIARRLPGAWGNPMVIAIALLVALLLATGTPYSAYFQGAQYVHFLLGPATVALAIPMHANLRQIRRSARALFPALLAGSLTAASGALLIGRALGGSRAVVLSLAPKSVTTPIAMGIAEQIGGQPSLAAAFVLLTGVVGTIAIDPLMRALRVTDWRAIGFAAGTAAHGLATAHVLVRSETAGAFGGLAIGMNGVLSSMIVPVLAGWLL